MRSLGLLPLMFAAALAVQPQHASAEITRQIPVTENFKESVIRIDGMPSARMRFTVISVGNVLELCGAVAYDGPQARSALQDVLQQAAFVVNGRKVIRDLTYWNRATSMRALGRSVANCQSTGVSERTEINGMGIDWPDWPFLNM